MDVFSRIEEMDKFHGGKFREFTETPRNPDNLFTQKLISQNLISTKISLLKVFLNARKCFFFSGLPFVVSKKFWTIFVHHDSWLSNCSKNELLPQMNKISKLGAMSKKSKNIFYFLWKVNKISNSARQFFDQSLIFLGDSYK